MKNFSRGCVLGVIGLALAACGQMPKASKNNPADANLVAMVELQPSEGYMTGGMIRFEAQPDGMIKVTGHVKGLKPLQEHGFHVHEKGDCSNNGMAAGGHLNPQHKAHGQPGTEQSHPGAMPNLRADENGEADIVLLHPFLTIGSGENDIVGKALIVHANPDDYTSQPVGNAGGRIACGIIRKM